MTTTINHWLQQEFRRARDVSGAIISPDSGRIFQPREPDLLIQTWMGARLFVYLVLTPPKIRDIRNVLRHNSRGSTGSLYVVHTDILPEDGSTGHLQDWQDALQRLNGGWIYSLSVSDGHLNVGQVHVSSTVQPGEYYCWHLNDFEIQTVTVKRRDIDSVVKGTWYVGDIASPEFKRRVNYERVNRRYHYRTQYRSTPDQTQKIMPDDLAAAYQVLQVERTASEHDVKRAFRRRAMSVHPDVSALPRFEAERQMRALIQAYDLVKTYHGWK